MPKRWRWIFVLALLAPLEARANGLTPVMLLTWFQLLIGNALIGIGEGLLLSRVFKTSGKRAVGTMILANYVSAWSGGILIALAEAEFGEAYLGDQPLYRVGTLIALAIAALFVVTVLIEWPFVAYVLRGRSRLVLKALPASLMVQTVSYLALAPLFYLASSTGLFKDVRRDASVVQQADARITVYYIGMNGRDVYRKVLRGGPEERVGMVPETMTRPVLVLRLNTGQTHWDLMVEDVFSDEHEIVSVVPEAARVSRSPDAFVARNPGYDEKYPTPYNGLDAEKRPPLGCSGNDAWHFRYPRLFDFAWHGLTFWNERTGHEYAASAEMPMLAWAAQSATRLPKDQVLFAFSGPKPQIVLLDMPSQRIGLVTLGRSPVATIDGAIPMWEAAPEGVSVATCEE
jgi:hypothetical protein